jgi:hypothetical protein
MCLLAAPSLASPSQPVARPVAGAHTQAKAPSAPWRYRRLFAPDSIWNRPLPATAALARTSRRDVRALTHQVFYSTASEPVAGWYAPGYGAAVMPYRDSPAIYRVPRNQPRRRVQLLTIAGVANTMPWGAAVQKEFDSVPVPTGVKNLAGEGTDSPLVIWQPSTDTMWEFWRFYRHGTKPKYTAEWGGRIQHVSRSNGVLPDLQGARATSLALAGGVIRMREYNEGLIPHALAITAGVMKKGFVSPATRSDGAIALNPKHDTRDAIQEGMLFRLPPTYSCWNRLPSHVRLLVLICRAARDYGIYVVDRSSAVNMWAESPQAVGTRYTRVHRDPWAKIFKSQMVGPTGVLQDFPWDKLERLQPLPTP